MATDEQVEAPPQSIDKITAVEVIEPDRSMALIPRNKPEVLETAEMVIAARMNPDGLNTVEKVAIAMMTGMEAGLAPMAAMRSLYVVKGMPAWRGGAALGMIRSKKLIKEYHREWFGLGEKKFDSLSCTVTILRKGEQDAITTSFSWGDAVRAGLSKKPIWLNYPKNMVFWRAVALNLNEQFQDVLLGLPIVEEARDYGPVSVSHVGSTEYSSPPMNSPLVDEIEADDETVDADGLVEAPTDLAVGGGPPLDDEQLNLLPD